MTQQKQRTIARTLTITAAVLMLLTAAVMLYTPPDTVLRTEPVADVSLPGTALLDLNRATAEELECLPGIGEARAEAILARREELGGFTTREDILSVPGIGEATLSKIEPYITCETRSIP